MPYMPFIPNMPLLSVRLSSICHLWGLWTMVAGRVGILERPKYGQNYNTSYCTFKTISSAYIPSLCSSYVNMQ